VRNTFKTVTERVSVIIQRINAPFVTDVWMWGEPDSVNDRVSQCCVGVFVVDSGSQR
jgi:hypothetical protein